MTRCSTFHFQLSFGMPSIGPGMVHSYVLQGRLLDDECVLLPIFLKAILCWLCISMKFLVLKEPEKASVASHQIKSITFFLILSHNSNYLGVWPPNLWEFLLPERSKVILQSGSKFNGEKINNWVVYWPHDVGALLRHLNLKLHSLSHNDVVVIHQLSNGHRGLWWEQRDIKVYKCPTSLQLIYASHHRNVMLVSGGLQIVSNYSSSVISDERCWWTVKGEEMEMVYLWQTPLWNTCPRRSHTRMQRRQPGSSYWWWASWCCHLPPWHTLQSHKQIKGQTGS